MDQETFNALVFMVFGLGFFLFVMHYITRDQNRAIIRKMNHDLALHDRTRVDRREFGFDAVEQSLEAQHKRKPLLRRII